MTEKIVQTAGREALGEFAPDFAHFNDDILFGENWNNTDIDLKTRSIITVVALMSQGVTDNSIRYHIQNAKNHGVSQREMVAVITHTAFYAGWPHAWSVFNIAKEIYAENDSAPVIYMGDEEDYYCLLEKSFLVSADNAQRGHPAHRNHRGEVPRRDAGEHADGLPVQGGVIPG